uniref:CAP-Gly domain-containing protein n=1 Tax=Macrostomum lignano TaxID=282301 RepID=A0A1I8FCD2_9PLAT
LNRLRQQREQPDMEFIRAELDSLRAELDVLRDRNYQLERENRRLLETGSPFFAADPYGLAVPGVLGVPGVSGILVPGVPGVSGITGPLSALGIPGVPWCLASLVSLESLMSGFSGILESLFYTMTIGSIEFETETRPYYGSLGRSPQPHQPHHRQQRQSRIGDKMRHSLDSEQRQQRQQQQREQQEAGQSRTPSRTFHSLWQPSAAACGLAKRSNGNIRQAAAAQLSYSASAQPPTGHLWPACDGAAHSAAAVRRTLVGCRSLQSRRRHPVWRPRQIHSLRRVGSRRAWCTLSAALPGRTDYYVGIELDQEEGKHDGVYDGRRYFQCKPRKGVFVAFNKLIMCYQAA